MSVASTDPNLAGSIGKQWPILYKDVLELGNLDSNVAICTLWTHRKSLARLFSKDEFAVIGNLYGLEGVTPIIRNVFANPLIRYIVLCGNDLSESGNAFVEFMTQGVDANHSTASGLLQVDRAIDIDSLNEFRSKVTLIDLRGESNNRVREVAISLPKLPAFSTPRYFPVDESNNVDASNVANRPSEISGFRVGANTVAETWLQVVHSVMVFGKEKYTKYGNNNELREILNLTAVISNEDAENEYLPDYMVVTRQQLLDYYPQVLEAKHFEGTEYSYGERLRSYEGIDQVQMMIDRLINKPSSKRLYASTWKVHIDSAEESDPPCLTQINGAVQDNQFLMTAHFRSQDMFGAWPLNAYAMRRLQAKIAREAQVPLGPLTMITHSAHIYAWDWPRTILLIDEYRRLRKPANEIDQRGYIVINIVDALIEARLYSLSSRLLDKVVGDNARKITLEIARRAWTADAGHALYLGRELMKAEIAAKFGLNYVQDAPLDLPSSASGNSSTSVETAEDN